MTDHSTHADLNAAGATHAEMAHVVPLRVLLAVFAALLVLTVMTVTAGNLQTGEWEIWISLGIATVKAGLVVAYFMHLRYDKPFNALLFLVSLAFLSLFLGLTLVDTQEYQPSIEEYVEEMSAVSE